MRTYLITVSWYAPYPKSSEFRIKASAIPTAVARALREWKKEIGRKRWENLVVKVVPVV
jgi:hypothetical protein